jgi:hypothetical protein
MLIKLEFSRQIKFNENLSSGSEVFPRGQTDMMTLIIAFCDVNVPKKEN